MKGDKHFCGLKEREHRDSIKRKRDKIGIGPYIAQRDVVPEGQPSSLTSLHQGMFNDLQDNLSQGIYISLSGIGVPSLFSLFFNLQNFFIYIPSFDRSFLNFREVVRL